MPRANGWRCGLPVPMKLYSRDNYASHALQRHATKALYFRFDRDQGVEWVCAVQESTIARRRIW
jgi:hypothetical protein